MAGPQATQERLSALPDGRLSLRLKRPLDDGRAAIELEPVELLRRLATLAPPPRAHLVRFHGVFGPASKWRSEVVPPPAEQTHALPADPPCESGPPPASREGKQRPPDARLPWAELLRRVFRLDVLACPCGGRRKVLAFITERTVARSILEAMGLPTTAPPISPARLRCEPGVELWQDDVPALQLR
jgi:hypothetical protein